MKLKKYFFLFIMIHTVFASDDYMVCRALGKNLIFQCVLNPINPSKEAVCAGLYNQYVTCITLLNGLEHKLIYDEMKDDYRGNVYSPCGYEISHLILDESGYCTNLW